MAVELGRGNSYPNLLEPLAQFEIALLDYMEEMLGESRNDLREELTAEQRQQEEQLLVQVSNLQRDLLRGGGDAARQKELQETRLWVTQLPMPDFGNHCVALIRVTILNMRGL